MGCKMINCMQSGCSSDTSNPSGADKWRYTIYTTILFLIIVCPLTYKIVNYILGSLVKICDKKGCPTYAGIFIHAIVFTLLLRCLMDLDI